VTHTRLVPSAVITMSFALDVQVGREPGPPGAIVVPIALPHLVGSVLRRHRLALRWPCRRRDSFHFERCGRRLVQKLRDAILAHAPIPDDWHQIGPRTSGKNRVGTNRNATHPVNAILNYAYAVLESQVRMQIAADGYDPTIGFHWPR
jgi:hypothetical protein